MLKEAGCNILDLKGNELSFNKDSYFNPSFVAFTHRKTVIDCGILQS
jgi:3'-phosphoadenosine 5'-phosphosulfate (PAPS) 3'-phosphatase